MKTLPKIEVHAELATQELLEAKWPGYDLYDAENPAWFFSVEASVEGDPRGPYVLCSMCSIKHWNETQGEVARDFAEMIVATFDLDPKIESRVASTIRMGFKDAEMISLARQGIPVASYRLTE